MNAQSSLLRFKTEEEARKRAREDVKIMIKQAGGKLNLQTLKAQIEEIDQKKEENDKELVYMIDRKV